MVLAHLRQPVNGMGRQPWEENGGGMLAAAGVAIVEAAFPAEQPESSERTKWRVDLVPTEEKRRLSVDV